MPEEGSRLPDVSKFKRPSVIGSDGKNLFAEPEGNTSAAADSAENAANPFAPSASHGAVPSYSPVFQRSLPHRGLRLLVLALISSAGVVGGLMGAMTFYFWMSVFMVLAFPLNVAISMLAFQDLRAIRLGAMHEEGNAPTKAAFYLTMLNHLIFLGVAILGIVVLVFGAETFSEWLS